jgi:hypothetical protein
VRACFEPLGAISKEAIAQVIVKRMPIFERKLPPARKPWQSKAARMAIFAAAASIWTFFQMEKE